MPTPHQAKQLLERTERFVGSFSIALIFTFLLLWLIDCAGGYVIGHFYHYQTFFPREVYFEPRPYIMFKGASDPEVQHENGLNSLGYRGPVPSKSKSPTEYRIAAVGGSTVLIGTPSMPQILESDFHEAGRAQVAVYNFGVASSVLGMDIARVVYEIGDYEPDMIIFYGGGNDLGMPYQSDPRPGYPPNFLAVENNPLLLSGTERQSWATLFELALFHSQLVRTFLGDRIREALVPLEGVRRESGWNTAGWSSRVAQSYLVDIKRADRIARAFGAKPVFLFQPVVAFKAHPSAAEQKLIEPELREHLLRGRRAIRDGMADLQSRGISFTDISTVFDSISEDVFTDGIHIRQQYQANIARAVFDAIRDAVPPPVQKMASPPQSRQESATP